MRYKCDPNTVYGIYSNRKISLGNYQWRGRERQRGRFKERWRGCSEGKRQKTEQSSLERGEKKRAGWWKKLKVKEANCVFQLLIGPVGHAGGYHSEISHLALFGIAVIRWAEADISKSETRPGQIPPALTRHSSAIMNYSLSSLACLFSFSIFTYISVSLFCHLFDWRQASRGYLIMEFVSLYARFARFHLVGFIDTSEDTWMKREKHIITSSICYCKTCLCFNIWRCIWLETTFKKCTTGKKISIIDGSI